MEAKRKTAGSKPAFTTSFIYGKDTAVFQHLQQLIDFMKQSQKLSDLLGVICVAFVFAGCVVGHDGGPTIWNLVCLAMAGLFGWLSKKTEGAR